MTAAGKAVHIFASIDDRHTEVERIVVYSYQFKPLHNLSDLTVSDYIIFE